MPRYINADLTHEGARVTCEEQALVDWLNDSEQEEYDQWLHRDDDGFLPTAEQEQAARDAAGYGQDDRVLCIDGGDWTESGQVIPEWAFE